MNHRFIYDEASSALYSPDGSFLKKLHCPKSVQWNQLVVNNDDRRWLGCAHCKERVLDLDQADTQYAIGQLSSRYSSACVQVASTSDKVIFLRDAKAPPEPSKVLKGQDRVIIHTARTLQDIDRAVGMGYWPDVRILEFETEKIRTKISVGQDPTTGAIETSADLRRRFRSSTANGCSKQFHEDESSRYIERIPFTNYYPYFQKSPIAAYLIPKDMKDGALVIVEDPIEDVVGQTWNQGSAYRAYDVPGYIKDRKVVLQPEKVKASLVLG